MTETMELPMTSGAVKGEALCKACGEPITTWAGRGRKPDYHPGHKPTTDKAPKSAAGARVSGQAVPTAQLDMAVGNVANLYKLMATGLMAVGALHAASMLAAEADTLNVSNREFLSRDPKLVALLNRGAAATGRGGFLATNLAVLAPVIMTAVREVSQAAADRREQAGHQ